MRYARPDQDQARQIKAALERQEQAKRVLVGAPDDIVAVRAAAEYLDATDALYETQINVPRTESDRCRPFADPPTHHHGAGPRCDCGARPNVTP